LKKFAKYPNINAELIRNLFAKYEHGHSKEIKEQLVEELYPLCFYIVNRYTGNPGIDDELLISYGVEGLIRGIETYDSTKVQYFFTHIDNSISRSMCKGIGQQYQMGIIFASRFNTLRKTLERYYGEKIEENITIIDKILEIMCKEKTVSEKNLEEVRFNILSKMVDDKKSSYSLEIEDSKLYSEVFDKEYLEHLKKDIENILSNFTDLQREIFIRRFGLCGNEPQNFQEIANVLRCERGNIWNICSRKIEQLKKKNKVLKNYDSYGIDEIDINSPSFGKRKVRK